MKKGQKKPLKPENRVTQIWRPAQKPPAYIFHSVPPSFDNKTAMLPTVKIY